MTRFQYAAHGGNHYMQILLSDENARIAAFVSFCSAPLRIYCNENGKCWKKTKREADR